jgi:hypothetical protein
MSDNPFLPLSFIAGPAILTNATAVLLNGASIRYNLAIGLWRDLQAELHGHSPTTTAAYPDRPQALALANRRAALIVTALTLLYAAVGGFGVSTLAGLAGAMLSEGDPPAVVGLAKLATVASGAFGLVCLLAAAVVFTLESRCTMRLLRLGMPLKSQAESAAERSGLGPSTTL